MRVSKLDNADGVPNGFIVDIVRDGVTETKIGVIFDEKASLCLLPSFVYLLPSPASIQSHACPNSVPQPNARPHNVHSHRVLHGSRHGTKRIMAAAGGWTGNVCVNAQELCWCAGDDEARVGGPRR